jgi:hypothetical protein
LYIAVTLLCTVIEVIKHSRQIERGLFEFININTEQGSCVLPAATVQPIDRCSSFCVIFETVNNGKTKKRASKNKLKTLANRNENN